MTTFAHRFSSYFLSSTTHYYQALELQRRQPFEEEIPNRKVSIEQSAQVHPVTLRTKEILDSLITPEIHSRIQRGNFQKNFYEQRGFRVLESGGTLVLEHQNLPGYLIKASRGFRQFTYGTFPGTNERVQVNHTNLLRARGRDHYAEGGIDPFFSLPEELLYKTQHGNPGLGQYYSISQKMDVFSEKESLDLMRDLSQNEQNQIAAKVCDFIIQKGMTDMHAGNLLVRSDLRNWTFALIDLEPVGLFIEEADNIASLARKDDWALGGLLLFRDSYCRRNGFFEMADYVETRIQNYLNEHQDIQIVERGTWEDQGNLCFDVWALIRILITIPFFFIILPVVAIRAHSPVLT